VADRNSDAGMFPAGAQSLLRSMNARAVLELIHRAGPIARSDIAAGTGLSKPTITLALNTLLAAGVVDETGYAHGRPGPAAALYRVRPASGLSVGVDIGHDRINAAIADITGEVHARTQAKPRRRRDTLVAQVRDLAADLAGRMDASVDDLVRVVVGVPAVVRPDGDQLGLCDSLPDDGAGFPQALRAAFGGVPVTLENDVNLAVLGERSVRGAELSEFVFFSIGTGLGVGIVLGGQLYRGVTGAAGEIGYLPGDDPTVPATPPHDRAMIKDTLSGQSIVEEGAARGLDAHLSAREVFDLARGGDAQALQVVDVIARRIAYVICSLTAVIDPALVVLGGGVGLNPDLLLDPVARHVRAMSLFAPSIEASQAGKDAVLLGAVSFASELARDTVFSAASLASPAATAGA
jgi:predicted NBD/HSP70 family sugar kinase